MRRSLSAALLLCAASVLSAAEFRDFQAASAVIGQPAFSSHDKGVMPRALSLGNGNLFVADASGHLFTFDLARIGASRIAGCPVCLVAPQASAPEIVFEGVAEVAVHGRTIVIADPKAHRVLIWNGDSPSRLPDVILSNFKNPTSVALDDQRLFVGDAGTHHVLIWDALPTSDSQPPDVTLGSADSDLPGADTIQTPAALASDGTHLYVADSAAHRVLVFAAADTPIPQAVNAASFLAGPLAPGTLVSIDHAAAAATTVFLNGHPIPITDSNADQVQIQIPYELNNATAASLWIKNELDNGSVTLSAPAALRYTNTSPGIFAFGAREPRTGLLLHAPAGIPLSPEDPAKPSELLTVWATGLGTVSSEANGGGGFDTLIPVRATLNGNAVEVVSAALPADATGVYEVRLRLPDQLASNSTLILLQNDSKSNPVTFPVESTQN
jgi:uncharacterized protein (TIGR03437 family)